ncbi:hypothetical protein B5K05_33215 [Rhizobium phaseoli]|uniref:GNAT family N-acetyltransferase n=1 Tax=Rhizobium phaseoli TaxID=396 RepID=UPI000E0D9C57|nr:hypothetical protein B5K05_33215 [Rhizobium phaseoli]RDJ00933.1 hypothetical protein B5K04_31300 [Rhizobium phaseoli]
MPVARELQLSAELKIRALSRDNAGEFFDFHERAGNWCFCVGWWTKTWDSWSLRTTEQNRSLRAALFEKGIFDGFLCYYGTQVVGWCQVGPASRYEKMLSQFDLAADDRVWAIGCILVHPDFRRRGISRFMIEQIIPKVFKLGAETIIALPKTGGDEDSADLWNGPRSVFECCGFIETKVVGTRKVVALARVAR